MFWSVFFSFRATSQGPILSIFWPRASRSSSRLGGTSGQMHGQRPKNRWRRRPKNRLCQVSLYVRLSSVPRRACLVLCFPVSYSTSAFRNRSHDGHREAFRLLMTGHFSRLRCPGVPFVLKLCKTAKCPSFVCYRFGCTCQVLVFHFKREHAVGRRSRISQEMTSGAVSAFLVRQRIHEPIRQSTIFGKITFFYVKMDLRSRGRHSSLRLLVLVRLRCTSKWIFWEMTSGPVFPFSLLLGSTAVTVHASTPPLRGSVVPAALLALNALVMRTCSVSGSRVLGVRLHAVQSTKEAGFLQTSTTFGSAEDTDHATVLSRFAASTRQ